MLALLSVIDEYVAVSNTNVHLRASANRPTRTCSVPTGLALDAHRPLFTMVSRQRCVSTAALGRLQSRTFETATRPAYNATRS